jgi:hypothetical protein
MTYSFLLFTKCQKLWKKRSENPWEGINEVENKGCIYWGGKQRMYILGWKIKDVYNWSGR